MTLQRCHNLLSLPSCAKILSSGAPSGLNSSTDAEEHPSASKISHNSSAISPGMSYSRTQREHSSEESFDDEAATAVAAVAGERAVGLELVNGDCDAKLCFDDVCVERLVITTL